MSQAKKLSYHPMNDVIMYKSYCISNLSYSIIPMFTKINLYKHIDRLDGNHIQYDNQQIDAIMEKGRCYI